MDRADIGWVIQNFTLVDGELLRLTQAGARQTVYVRDGIAHVLYKGKEYRADTLAYVLHLGVWCAHRLVPRDGNPTNFHLANLLVVSGRSFRYTPRKVGDVWTHALSKMGFADADACRDSWLEIRADAYAAATAAAIRDDRVLADSIGNQSALYARRDDLRRAAIKKRDAADPHRVDFSRRPSKPKAVPGKIWHNFEGGWVLTPAPVSWMDDYMVRCHAVKYLSAHRMSYDEELGRVVAYTAMDRVKVQTHQKMCQHKWCRALPVRHEERPPEEGRPVGVYDLLTP